LAGDTCKIVSAVTNPVANQPAAEIDPPPITRKTTRWGLPPLGDYLAEAYRYRTFAIYWSKADIKARNFETFFGRAWHVLNPLLFGLIYFIFVGILSNTGLDDIDRLALIVGNLYVWVFFSSAVITGVGAVQGGAGGLMSQSAIPRIVLPAASTLTAANLFLRSLLAYVPFHFLAERGVHANLLWIPVLILLTGLFGFGLSLLFAVLNVYLRDTSRLLPHAFRLWLYLTPAIWEYTRVLGDSTLDVLARLNPMFSGMTAWTIAFGGSLDPSGPSIGFEVLVFAGWAVLATLVGFLIFVMKEDDFAVRN
jgi:teichoic acid transport system permease protein